MKTILILAAAAATFTAAPALAQELDAGQVRVGYADLDLSTRAGVRTLDRRIRSAVELACGPISSSDPRGKNLVIACRTETLAEARAQRDVAIAAAAAATPVRLAAQH